MADYGLLQGLGEGLKAGIQGYQTERNYYDEKLRREQERKDKLEQQRLAQAMSERSQGFQEVSKGYNRDEFGNYLETPEHKEERAVDLDLKRAHAEHYREQKSGQKEKDPLDQALKQARLRDLITKENDKKEAKNTAKPEQAKAATFAQRLQDAEKEFSNLASQGYDRTAQKSGLLNSFAKAPLIGGIASSFLPENEKRQEQSERNFVNAILRRESGAAISPTEFSSAEKQYFPRVGDTSEVLRQKAENRQASLAGLLAEAGPAMGLLQGKKAQLPAPVLPKQGHSGLISDANASSGSSTPKYGEILDGYQFKGGNPADPNSWVKVQ